MRKKIFTIALSAIMVIAMAVPVFANITTETTISPSSLSRRFFSEQDTDHAFNFSLTQFAEPNYSVLNCHTNATVPSSGTPVSLWNATGDETQSWYLDNTKFATGQTTPIRPNNNRSLALNAGRSYVGTICNVLTSANNVYNDYNCTVEIISSLQTETKVVIRLPKRYNHLNQVYVTYGRVGDYCRWNYSNTDNQNQIWYLRDGPAKPY